jgi:DNA-3-methyladenine glycosylase II
MSDEEIIERLTTIRGIGRWTVEMLLMFRLGRADVLPVGDYAVRKGFQLTYGLDEMPKPKELEAYGERWRPFRSAASWYMWQAVHLERQK